MAKSKSIPVPNPEQDRRSRRETHGQPEPLSGSKKTKQRNHVRHNNPEG